MKIKGYTGYFILGIVVLLVFTNCSFLDNLFSSPPRVRIVNEDVDSIEIGFGQISGDFFNTEETIRVPGNESSPYEEIEKGYYDVGYHYYTYINIQGGEGTWYLHDDTNDLFFENGETYTIIFSNSQIYFNTGTIAIN